MFTKRKLKAEVVRLTYRVAELEERLCPCESHDWKRVGVSFEGGTGVGDETTFYHYKCRRCGKQLISIQPLLERSVDNE